MTETESAPFWSLQILDTLVLKCVRNASGPGFSLECWVDGVQQRGSLGAKTGERLATGPIPGEDPMEILQRVVLHMVSNFQTFRASKYGESVGQSVPN